MDMTRDPAPAAAPGSEGSTLERLIAVARARFATDGYPATSLDTIAADAGVTKGSLYHHFDGKADLFSDVFEDEQAALSRRIAEASAREDDPWDAAHAGLRAFLDTYMDPGVQQITLVDAPSALGWEQLRALREPYGLAVMKAALEALAADGRLRFHTIESLAHLLFGALCEAALYIAAAEDRQAARDEMERELERLLETIAPRE